jgi:hypothetical protein
VSETDAGGTRGTGRRCRGPVAGRAGAVRPTCEPTPRPPHRARRLRGRRLQRDLVFGPGGLLEPSDRRLAFLSRAAAAGGLLETGSRRLKLLRVPQRGREVHVGHPAKRPPADAEQIADPLPRTVRASQ